MGVATTARRHVGKKRSLHARTFLSQEMATLSQSQTILEDDTCQQGGNEQSGSELQGDAAPNWNLAVQESTDGDGLMDSSGSDPDFASVEEIPGSTNDDQLMDTLGANPDLASLEEITNSMDDDELMEYIRSDSDLASRGEILDSTDAYGSMDSDLQSLEVEIRAFDAVVKDFLRTHYGSGVSFHVGIFHCTLRLARSFALGANSPLPLSLLKHMTNVVANCHRF